MASWRRIEMTAGDGERVLADVRDGGPDVLVLLAGTWGNAEIRGPFVDAIDARLTLVCATLAGQDDNWPPPAEASIPIFSQHVLELADHLALERFFVGGHSLGGMIAIDMLRFGPERLRGAVSMEGWTHWSVKQAAFGGDVSSTLDADQRQRLADARAKLLDRWPADARERFTRIWQQWNGWDILSATSVPVLEIWGDRGRPCPARATMRIPDRTNIELAWIPEASHSLLIEAPVQVAGLINGFIARVGVR